MNIDLSQLHFLRPEWLLAVIPFLLLSVLLWRSHTQRSSWRKVVDSKLLPYLLQDDTIQHYRWPIFLITLGGLLASIAMAGPTWERLPQPIFRNDAALVILLDLSRSMDAQDIKPSRLQRAHFKITDILKARQEGQVALIVYAADAFTVTPLTDDDDTIISQLSALTTSLVPAQGSRADIAMQMAGQLLKQASQTRGQVLLITDEVQTMRGIEAAQSLAKDGYQLSILGVGTTSGAPIPDRGGMLKNGQGDIVIAKLFPDDLRRIAAAGNGHYTTITGNDDDIQRLNITDGTGFNEATSEEENLTSDRWREAGPWLLLPLLLLAPMAFRRGILILACLIIIPLPQPVQAFEWRDLWQTPDQQAQQLFQQEKPAEAAQQFKDPAWRASANYQSDNFEDALQDYQSLQGADARYNEGNTLARLGKLKEAIKAYDQAIEKQPDHEDAIYNRQLVEEQLKQQEEQNQEQEEQNQEQEEQNQEQEQQEQGARDKEQEEQNQEQEQQEQGARDKGQEEQNQEQEQQEQGARDKEQEEQNQEQEQGTENQEPMTNDQQLTQEEKMSQEQWLKRIPDDPAGLLRRKFEYQYRQRARTDHGEQQW